MLSQCNKRSVMQKFSWAEIINKTSTICTSAGKIRTFMTEIQLKIHWTFVVWTQSWVVTLAACWSRLCLCDRGDCWDSWMENHPGDAQAHLAEGPTKAKSQSCDCCWPSLCSKGINYCSFELRFNATVYHAYPLFNRWWMSQSRSSSSML